MADPNLILRLHSWTNYLWILFIAVWIVSAPRTKKTVQQESGLSRLGHGSFLWLGSALMFVSHFRWLPLLDSEMFQVTTRLAEAGFGLVVCGLAICFWARFTLGRNWSGLVTLKKGHTLVMHGPYRMVRHPIYSGLLLMGLGVTLQYGLWRDFAAMAIFTVGFWLKSRAEEQFMLQQFGPQYVAYRRRVCALVPFLF